MTIALLADFGVRLACGLAVLLLATPWRVVPPAFFRTHCLVILGLLVLAVLDLGRTHGAGPGMWVVVGAGTAAYLAAIAWGLGVPRLGVPLSLLIALATGGVLVASSRGPSGTVWALVASRRLSSAFLMGSTLTAMLLGHYYLTAPAMSIAPLRRFVRCMAWGLGARVGVEALGYGLGLPRESAVMGVNPVLFSAIRWGMGFGGPALATSLTWKTVEIRSTQSATGILYIAMTLVLFGELTG